MDRDLGGCVEGWDARRTPEQFLQLPVDALHRTCSHPNPVQDQAERSV